MTKEVKTDEMIKADPDFIELRKNYCSEFDLNFRVAFNSYIKGDWLESLA